MASRLLTLPNEVQHLIVAQIPHPADLKALCLVSKHVSAIATQHLYRDLVMPYDDTAGDWIDIRYLLESRGLQHVRTLTVDSNNVSSYGFCKPLDQLLTKLPLNSLTHFWYGPLGQPTDEGLRYLLHHQGNLTNLQLDYSFDFTLEPPSLEQLIRDEGTAIRSLKSLAELDLTFGNEGDTSSEIYRELFGMIDTTKLRKVVLFANGRWDNNTGEEPMKRILKIALSTSLTHIDLTNVCLPQSNREHLQLDNFHSLRYLKLHQCTNVATSLGSFRRPILKSFDIQFGPIGSPDRDLEAVNALLQRFESLNRLVISSQVAVTEYEVLVALEHSVANHAESLSSLIINIGGYDDSWIHLSRVSLRCKNLSQLVLCMGLTDLMNKCRILVLGLPRLVTLNIIRPTWQYWPDQPMGEFKTPEITTIAKGLFNRMPQKASLSLLAFGGAYHYCDREEKHSSEGFCKRWCFFRHQVRNRGWLGWKKAVPILIPIDQAKYVESESEVLEYRFPYSC